MFPLPEIRVPDMEITCIVGKYIDSQTALQAAISAVDVRYPDTMEAMLAATDEFSTTRRRRDVLFPRALPGDGTIPTALIAKFGIGHEDLHRLVPGLAPMTPAMYGRP